MVQSASLVNGHTLASWRLAKGANRLETEKLRRERPDIVENTETSPFVAAYFSLTTLGQTPHIWRVYEY